MTYTLIAGVGPVPVEAPSHQMAPGLRLWSLAQVARRATDKVTVLSCDHFGHAEDAPDRSEYTTSDGILVLHVRGDGLSGAVDVFFDNVPPRCVITTTDLVGAEFARQLPPEVPLWVDLYGDPLAEGQLLAARHRHDGGLGPLAANMAALLTRGDRFSACSRAHRHALLGQLGMVGRLNAACAGSDLVSVLPGLLVAEPSPPPAESPLRGSLIAEGDFAVLWCGGFNTWTDTETLFAGLTRAMEREPRLRFICLGGAIDRHNPGTYREFEERVAGSAMRDRFHLLGWRPQGEVAGFIAEADVGLNIDGACHEAELGTRTRLLEWAQGGLAIVSTPISEMTRDLAEAQALQPFEVGNADSLAQVLTDLTSNSEKCRALGERAREFVLAHWTPETASDELADWVREPRLAPDRQEGSTGGDTNRLVSWIRALEPALRSDEEPPADLAQQTHRLRSLEGSRLVRWRDRLRGR